MWKTFGKILSHAAGAVVGLLTGIAAGFLPGLYSMDSLPADENGMLAAVYILSLPFAVIMHMARGAYTGATQGLTAGFVYPRTVQQELAIDSQNDKLADKVQSILKKVHPRVLLSELEEKEFEAKLKDLDPDLKEYLNDKYNKYNQTIAKHACILTNKSLKKLKLPLAIEINNQFIICEAEALAKKISACEASNKPVYLVASSSKHALQAKNVGVLTAKKLFSDDIIEFINKVRNMISPTKSLYSMFSVDGQTSFYPEKVVTVNANLASSPRLTMVDRDSVVVFGTEGKTKITFKNSNR